MSVKENKKKSEGFETVIRPKHSLLNVNLREVWRYRDLISLFIKRNFISLYKQTILGPLWAIIQPLLTTIIFTVVFGNLAGLAPSGVPTFLFYLSGSVLWAYFSGCLTKTSTTFTSNASIMGKVYFPRLVMPISTVLSGLISFAIQFAMLMAFWAYYLIFDVGITPNLYMLFFPLIMLQLAMLSLGFGIIVSSLTTKYRDLVHLISFGVQLWMYATPVAYDVSIIPKEFMGLYMLNPVTPIINTFRYAFLGVGSFDLTYYLISWVTTLVVLFLGVLLFNKVEKTFMDTV